MNNIYNFQTEILNKLSKKPIKEKICLWVAHNLEKAEIYSGGLSLSSTSYRVKRKKRPFLSIYCEGNTFAVLYLTLSPFGYQRSVDLKNCNKEGCPDFSFQEKSFLFRRKGKYVAIPMNKLQMEEIATLCGCCENLERLKKFCSKLTEVKNAN
jgi:hypothetical protein